MMFLLQSLVIICPSHFLKTRITKIAVQSEKRLKNMNVTRLACRANNAHTFAMSLNHFIQRFFPIIFFFSSLTLTTLFALAQQIRWGTPPHICRDIGCVVVRGVTPERVAYSVMSEPVGWNLLVAPPSCDGYACSMWRLAYLNIWPF